MPLLTLDGVVAGYGAVEILHGVSLTVEPGAVTALVGGNGAGKTTIMRTIAGVLPVRAGRLLLRGEEITATRPSARVDAGIALVPEGRLVFPTLSVEENLRLGAIAPRARATVRQRLAEMYARFPRLRERRRQSAGSLSGGEQQMLVLARGLMACPDLLLLDEPTLGLSPAMTRGIFETLARLAAEGLTILLAEQDVRRALELAETAYVVENGRVTLSGPGRDLVRDGRVRAAYLGLP